MSPSHAMGASVVAVAAPPAIRRSIRPTPPIPPTPSARTTPPIRPTPPARPARVDAPGLTGSTRPEAPGLTKPPTVPQPSAEASVRALGLSLMQASLYGLRDTVTAQALLGAVATTLNLLQSESALSLAVVDGQLLANNKPIDSGRSPVLSLVDRLRELEVGGFSLLSGIPQTEIVGLVAILAMDAEDVLAAGGFDKLVQDRQFQHIEIRRVSYEAVKEDEVVVEKDCADRPSPAANETNESLDDIARSFSVAAAYLNGDLPVEEDDGCKAVRAMADVPEHLSEAICDGVDLSADEDPESMAQRLLDKVSSAYKALSLESSSKTQAGKRKLATTLRHVKDGVTDRLQAAAGENAKQAAELVAEGMDRMVDGVKLDAMATEYMHKHNALESNEQRLLRFMRAKQVDPNSQSALHDRLRGEGLSEAEWQDLVMKAGGSPRSAEDPPPAQSVAVDAAALAGLFADLEELSSAGSGAGNGSGDGDGNGPDTAKMAAVLAQIDREFEALMASTEEKMDGLEETIQKYYGEEGGDQKKVAATLGELVQEICQPLSVVNCCVGIIRRRSADSLGEAERHSLDLAVEGGERLQKLIGKISNLVKEPEGRSPDAEIIAQIYR